MNVAVVCRWALVLGAPILASQLLLGPAAGGPPEERLPVPDEAAQTKARAVVKEVFRRDFANARTDQQKVELAHKLVAKARTTTDDPAGRLILLREARAMAVEVTDFELALETADLMADWFQTDPLTLKLDVLTELSTRATSTAQRKVLAEHAERALDQAVAAARFQVAGKLGDLAIRRLRRARDPELLKRFAQRLKEVKRLQTDYEALQQALVVLAEDPLQAESNLAAGRYLCFGQANWEKGLPMLALGSDAELRAVAVTDLKDPQELKERIDLADRWWQLAERHEGYVRSQMRNRAGRWYRKAEPDVSGLTKTRIEQRLMELTEEAATPARPAQGKTGLAAAAARPGHDRTARGDDRLAAMAGGLKTVCGQLQSGQGPKKLQKDAVAFAGPGEEGRRGANGFVLPPLKDWPRAGTAWSCQYQRDSSAGSIQFIHPVGSGHLLVTVAERQLHVTSAASWSLTGYRGGRRRTQAQFQAVKNRSHKIRLADDRPQRLASIVRADGAYLFFVDRQLVAEGQMANPPPLDLDLGFRGKQFSRVLAPGQAGILIGPAPDGSTNRAADIRFGPVRAAGRQSP